MKHILSTEGMTKEFVDAVISKSLEMKNTVSPRLGKSAALLFNRPSTRTIVSFEAALEQMGYGSIHLDYGFTQLVRGEDMKDVARTLNEYVALIVARLFPHTELEKLAAHSKMPVINAGSDVEHPCQALADILTLHQEGLLKKGTKMAYVGESTDGVVRSLARLCKLYGVELTIVGPTGFVHAFDNVKVEHNISFINSCDVVYVNSWLKGSLQDEDPKKVKGFLSFQVNEDTLTSPSVKVMHPQPAFRGVEISDSVLDGAYLVPKQAKNRMYVQKALISLVTGST